MIDKFSLKLTDYNKELEYITQVQNKKIVLSSIKKIYVLLVLFVYLLLEGVISLLIKIRKKNKN